MQAASAGVLALLLTGPMPATAAAPAALVSSARSAHFEVLSDGPLEDARQAAVTLERFRELLASLTALPAPTSVTRVIALRDGRLFDEVVPRHEGRPQAVDGFYVTSASVPTVVVRVHDEQGLVPAALHHEYTHIFFNALLPAQPVWVSEGLADLYSTVEETSEGVRMGNPPVDHLRTLREQALLTVPALLQVGYSSPSYLGAAGRPLLYAESWALVHSLVVARGRGSLAGLLAYLAELSGGGDDAALFGAHFGSELAGDTAPLLVYGLGAGRPTLTRARPPHGDAGVTAAAVAPAEGATALAQLLLFAGRRADARASLRAALAADEAYAPAHEALALLSLQEQDFAGARAHSARALALQPRSPAALLRHAQSVVREAAARGGAMTDAEEDEAVRALEAAVALGDATDPDACELLARLRPQPLASRIRLLEAARARHPERGDLGLALANLHLMRNDYTAARHALVRARLEARDETVAFLARYALDRLRALSRGKLEVRGHLTGLSCRPGGALEFQLRDGSGRRLRLLAPSPTAVFLYETNGEPLSRTLTCGPQDTDVTGWYGDGAPPGFDGTLLSLTFPGQG